ncbi:hypothetical protein ASD28_12610 [Massilia sp. Root133]|nr:hypothetical protein ASD28_12610 [Massilia sp. Root133]
MREYCLKPPAKDKTTAFICYQYYDRTQKKTLAPRYASFNLATNPDAPKINITEKGAAVGYTVSPEHLAEVKKWLKKNGTYGRPKVPSRVLARVRAEVEEKVRAELGAPALTRVATPAKGPAVYSVGEKIRALCAATDDLLKHVTTHAAPKESLTGLAPEDLFALRLHLNFGERALRYALRSAGVTATDFAPVVLVAEAAEALRRYYITAADVEAARQAEAKSKATKEEKKRKAEVEKNDAQRKPTVLTTSALP